MMEKLAKHPWKFEVWGYPGFQTKALVVALQNGEAPMVATSPVASSEFLCLSRN